MFVQSINLISNEAHSSETMNNKQCMWCNQTLHSRLVSEQIPLCFTDFTDHKKKKKSNWPEMSLVISLGDYLVKNRFVYRAKHIFCSACGSSISQAIYGKIKAYVNSGCVFSLIEPVNMPHMWPDALKCHWNKQECLGNFHTRACSFRFTVIQKKKQKYICSPGYCRFKINVESANQTANTKKHEA